jgi:hypothetical protein
VGFEPTIPASEQAKTVHALVKIIVTYTMNNSLNIKLYNLYTLMCINLTDMNKCSDLWMLGNRRYRQFGT